MNDKNLLVEKDEKLDPVSDFELPTGQQLMQEVKQHAWFV